MAGWSPEIANEFIRRAAADGKTFTQMQLQKLVYIAHGWTLAITNNGLTHDSPHAWEYGPVYRSLRDSLRRYGSSAVTREIENTEFSPGVFSDDPTAPAHAHLAPEERAIIDRVYKDYGGFHAFKLSALTHQPGTPWSEIYNDGEGKFDEIPADLIRRHFVGLATRGNAAAHN